MNRSSISNSNALILSPVQWVITIFLFVIICTIVYIGWFSWEQFEPGKDFRPLCWDERMSDYWSHFRWSKYAQERYKVFLIGDSVFWGQEVDNDQTISHYLNEHYEKEIFANLGIDGLFQAGNGVSCFWLSPISDDRDVLADLSIVHLHKGGQIFR